MGLTASQGEKRTSRQKLISTSPAAPEAGRPNNRPPPLNTSRTMSNAMSKAAALPASDNDAILVFSGEPAGPGRLHAASPWAGGESWR